ncbi:MAG TPA: ABC transporter permease [Vicinamibacterales bacterium]|nr:ABC transporter permease [Vicinamibacterales bacterium]
MTFTSTIGIAFEAITRNKLRSALTSLGVIMGVAAVIVMMALGDGAKASIEQRVSSLGTDILTVSAGSANVGGVRTGQGAVTTLTAADAAAIARLPGVRAVSPGVGTRAQVVGPAGNWQTRVEGVGAAFADIRAWDVTPGGFFTEDDVERASRVVVLGAMVRDQVFGADVNPVGEIIRVNNQPFRVIGVLERKGQSAFGQDQDDTVVAPYSAVQKRLQGTTHLSNILVAAGSDATVSQLMASVSEVLRARHQIRPGETDDFSVRSPEEMARVLSSTTDTMAYLLASVAAISLIVGGIGIMNIMLVSVTERTKEIGLRRALGAKRIDVLRQFVAEALSLSLAGGTAGVLLGIASSYVLSAALNWTTAVSTMAIALSFGFSAMVGVVFGYVPARRAAALMPTEALRYE